jgi:hypothetical protein
MQNITLDHQPFTFNDWFLPCLISWAEKSWASFFSICLVANLIHQWAKIIYFTAFPMAKEELFHQSGKDKLYEIGNETDITHIPNDKSLVIQSGNKTLFQQTIQNLNHLNDYVIFIKNIEEYDETLLKDIPKNQRIIISWNLDACLFKENLLHKVRTSKILFTKSKDSDIQIPDLEKYESYLINEKTHGIVRIAK